VAALLQDANQVTTDEATGAGDDHEIILGHLAGAFPVSIYRHHSPSRLKQLL
jgi:hypothetical protein